MLSRDEFDTLFDHLQQHYNTPTHDKEEFWSLYERVRDLGAQRVLEIGDGHGGTIGFWDILVGERAGRVVGVSAKIEIPFEYQPTSEFTLMEANPRSSDTVAEVRHLVDEVDFLFYGIEVEPLFDSLVRPDGLIATTNGDGHIVYPQE